MLEPARAGLTKTGSPSASISRDATTAVSPGRARRRAPREARGPERRLHELLVHANGRREHARADVAHVEKLERALDGSVLAPRTVKHGEGHVYQGQAGVTTPSSSRRSTALSPATGGQQARALASGSTWASGRRSAPIPRGLSLCDGPRPIAADAHGEDVPAVTIDRAEHPARGGARDLMLRGPAAKEHRDGARALSSSPPPCGAGQAARRARPPWAHPRAASPRPHRKWERRRRAPSRAPGSTATS